MSEPAPADIVERLRDISECVWWDWGYEDEHTHGADRAFLHVAATHITKQQDRINELETALRAIAKQQPETIAWMRQHGVVFAGPLGADPKNFEHVAFSIYTDLCSVDSIARNAIAEDRDD